MEEHNPAHMSFSCIQCITRGATASNTLDAQCMLERAGTLLPAVQAGVHFITCGGTVESSMAASHPLLVLDDALCGMALRLARGIEVNDETLATDLIIEKGPGEDYLTEDHTVRHMRQEFFMPDLANREKRESDDADDDALTRAKRLLHNIRSERPENRLDDGIRDRVLQRFPEILTGYVRLVTRAAGGRTVLETIPC